jgi:hypothetical protein
MANERTTPFTQHEFESGIKKLDVRDFIFNLEPDEAPFITMLSKVRKESVQDTEFAWFEDAPVGKYTQVDAQSNGGEEAATEIHVDDADIFMVDDVVKLVTGNCAGELMLVTDVDVSDNHIHVTRNWGVFVNTGLGHLATGDYIFRLGNAKSEGWTIGNQLLTTKTKVSNYVQLFARPVQITDTAEAIATFGGNRRNYERKKVGVELKKDIETQFLFGEPKYDHTGPRYQTGGVSYFMGTTSPSLNAAGALHKDDFDGWLRDAFAYGSSEKTLFASGLILSYINAWADSYVRVAPGDIKRFGIKYSEYTSPFGTVNIIYNKNFVGPYAGQAFLLDMKDLVYRFLPGLDLSLKVDLQPKNAHYKQDEYSGQIGLELHNALHQARVYGVS